MTSYFHGGPRGLRRILPPSVTGAHSSAEFGNHVVRHDRVYVTTNYTAAAMYAALQPCGKGVVYEVRPLGKLEHDPDCKDLGLSFQCESALVLKATRLKTKHRLRILRELMTP